jgi:hypothetical protein
MSENPVAVVYEGNFESSDPIIEDGELKGRDFSGDEIDLSEGTYRLVPGFATRAQEEHVIRVYEVDAESEA